MPLHCTDQYLADPLDVSRVCVLGAVVAPLGRAIRHFRGNHRVPLRVTFARDGLADFPSDGPGFRTVIAPSPGSGFPRPCRGGRRASAGRVRGNGAPGAACARRLHLPPRAPGRGAGQGAPSSRRADAERPAEPAAAPLRRHRPDARWRRGGRARVAGGHRGVRPREGRHRRGLRHDVAHLRTLPGSAALRRRDARPALADARARPGLRQGRPATGLGDLGDEGGLRRGRHGRLRRPPRPASRRSARRARRG